MSKETAKRLALGLLGTILVIAALPIVAALVRELRSFF